MEKQRAKNEMSVPRKNQKTWLATLQRSCARNHNERPKNKKPENPPKASSEALAQYDNTSRVWSLTLHRFPHAWFGYNVFSYFIFWVGPADASAIKLLRSKSSFVFPLRLSDRSFGASLSEEM